MNIQWFPGHMTRARREIEQKLGLLDIVIELLDARIPFSSRNPMIDDILQGKKRLVVLNKADLADPQTTEEWLHFFRADQGLQAIPIDSAKGSGVSSVVIHAENLMSEQRENQRSKGIQPRAIRGLIVGIPNVGKSTLINRLAGRQIAETGDRPGVTKGQQWIKVGKTMELLDTPGILWPKFEDPQVGLRLAITGAIKHNVLDVEEVAFETVKWLLTHMPDRLQERYQIASVDIDIEDPMQVVEIMEEMGRQRGCLRSGGQIDLEKISGILLREFRSGKLGRYSIERPGEQL